MYKLLRGPGILLVTLLFLFIVYLYKWSENHSESSGLHKYLDRDYVLSDEIREESIPSTSSKKSIRRKKVNIYKKTNDVYPERNIQRVYLKTLKGKTPIFVHSAKVDNMISAHVRDYGTWEEDLLNQTGKFLLRYPGITFIDIGCNIGVYSLFVAKLGMKVVSVDPVEKNLKLLSRSLDAGNFVENVTLVLNAVSDDYKTVSVDIPKDNIGGAHIVDLKHDSENNVIEAETIILNDIIPYVKSDQVFIKMDVEGHEWNILKGGHNFFQTKNVKGILMEWVHYRHQKNGQLIVEHLMKNGLLPYTTVSMEHILDPDGYYAWPENVFWIKR